MTQASGIYEALVIGGGPAGLSAALYLARLDRRAALFDTGHGRSSWHQVNHNYLGFPGGVPAKELREAGRSQLADYPQIELLEHKIETLSRQADGTFLASGQAGEWQSQTVIFCTGVIDQYPHFEDWQDYVGRSMHWCLVCDGYEARDKRVVVIGNTNSAVLEVLQMTRFTTRIVLLTNSQESNIDPAYKQRLAQAGVPLIQDKICRAVGKDGQLEAIYIGNGDCMELDKLFCHRPHVPQTKLAAELGVETDPEGYILTDTEQKTNVPGFYAAGDVSLLYSHQISAAVHEGAQAALTANYYLYPPQLKD